MRRAHWLGHYGLKCNVHRVLLGELVPKCSCSSPHKALSSAWINIRLGREAMGPPNNVLKSRGKVTPGCLLFVIQTILCLQHLKHFQRENPVGIDKVPSMTKQKESSAHLLGHLEFPKLLSTWTSPISELLGFRTQCCPLALPFGEA